MNCTEQMQRVTGGECREVEDEQQEIRKIAKGRTEPEDATDSPGMRKTGQ